MNFKYTWIFLFSLALQSPYIWAENDVVGFEILMKTSSSWDGSPLPYYPSGAPQLTILKVVIPPGKVVAMHKHPMINAGVLLSGELIVISDDGSKLRLSAGEAIVEVVDTWHFGRNDGVDPAVMLVFYAGVEGQQMSIKK